MSATTTAAQATTAETSTSEYCGLDCSFLLEQLEDILDPIITHSTYDCEFAPIMVQKLIDRCNEVKTYLIMNALEAEIVKH